LRPYFELKDGAHPCYELCRSLKLAGTDEQVVRRASIALAAVKDIPTSLRALLAVLRFWAGSIGTTAAALYYVMMIPADRLLPGKPLWFQIISAVALILPYSITSFIACRDLMHSLPRKGVVATTTTIGCSWLLGMAALSGDYATSIFTIMAYLLHVASAVLSVWWTGSNDRAIHAPCRVAMLHNRFLGIDGAYFVWKALAMQMFTVVLQTTAKLDSLAAMVWIKGAAWPGFDSLMPTLAPIFWTFVGALLVNAIYPGVLLQCRNRMLQRDAAAAMDGAVGFIYVLIFALCGCFTQAWGSVLPVKTYAYVSNLWPLIHMVTVARSLEAAAAQRACQVEASADTTPLPRRAAVCFWLIALTGIATEMFTLGQDRYPFGDWNHHCRPCVCDEAGALISCAVPAEFQITDIFLANKGINGIVPGAFKKFDLQGHLDLSHNTITTLRAGSFEGLKNLKWHLDLSSNNMSNVEPGAFVGLASLTTLFLRDNRLRVLRSGTFDGLRRLWAVFLDGNTRLKRIEVGAFTQTPALKRVWAAALETNCTLIHDLFSLPDGVMCIDEPCIYDYTRVGGGIGNGVCESELDRQECLWDGGDC